MRSRCFDTFGGHLSMNLGGTSRPPTASSSASLGKSGPQRNRKIIGNEFSVFEEAAREIAGHLTRCAPSLSAGTLYPTSSSRAPASSPARIKTHHNVGGLPRT